MFRRNGVFGKPQAGTMALAALDPVLTVKFGKEISYFVIVIVTSSS